MKKTRKERGWLKKTFKRAMDKELREHKSSFIVFYILRVLGDRISGAPDHAG
ncbi:MAG: hypothetical protein ACLU38_01610 [Dysosmobacter sp.]